LILLHVAFSLRLFDIDLIVECCSARRSLNIALGGHHIHVREQLRTVARYRNFDFHLLIFLFSSLDARESPNAFPISLQPSGDGSIES
jgi:hypothetical protein